MKNAEVILKIDIDVNEIQKLMKQDANNNDEIKKFVKSHVYTTLKTMGVNVKTTLINTEDIFKDIQFLLYCYEGYIEDIGGEPWKNKEFINLAKKYNFNKENLHKGIEHLTY